MLLEMRDIRKDVSLGAEQVHILKGVDLSVEEGDYLAIMGPSGSGKTTLMNLIGCLDVPTSGSYELAGRDVVGCSPRELARIRNREIGFVFQSFNLLPKLSALDNVALPLLYAGAKKDERRRRAREALVRVGLGDRLDHRPDQLSGGQSQRVAIARAVVGNPRLILADEPTGALDSANGAAIMDLFDELHREGATIVMITHDGTVARRAQHIKHLLDGVFVDGAAALARDMADVVAEAADLAEEGVASQVTKAFEALGEGVREDAGADAIEGVREDALAGGDEGETVEGDRLPWDDKPAWDGDGAWDDDRVWDEEFTWSGDDAVTGIMPPIAEDVGSLDSEATGILEPVRADATEVMRPLVDATEVMAPIDVPKAAVPIDATLVMPPVGEDGPAAKDGSALKGAKPRKAKAGKGERRG